MTQERSALGFAAVLLRQRRLIVVLPIVFGLLALVISLLSRSFVAESKFLPQRTEGNLSRLGGLAAQFGLPLNLGDLGTGGESPDFYAALARSREVLLEAALTEYRVPVGPAMADTVTGTLLDLFDVRGRTPEQAHKAVVKALEHRVFATVEPRAGVVVLQTVARYPRLAEEVNRRVLELVQQFNQEKRQSIGGAERRFTEQRLSEAQQNLEAAENELSHFIQQNRVYRDSPELTLEYSRLERTVEMRQQVFTSLSQAYEQARLAEVRNTPLITIVEAPEESAEPRVRVRLNAVLGALFGLFLAVGIAFVREYLVHHREAYPAEYQEVGELARRAVAAFVPAWRRRRTA